MSYEQLPNEIDEILTNTNTNTKTSLLADRKKAPCKLAVKVPLDTRISPEYNAEIKSVAQQYFGVGLRKRVWVEGKPTTALSAMADMVCEYGLAHVNKILAKQQQPTITTTYKKAKKKQRGDVKVNLILIKEYLLKGSGGIYVKGESPTNFGLTKIRSAIATLEVNDPRTVDEYVHRVCSGCGDAVAVGTRDSVFNLSHFFERDDIRPTKPKSVKNRQMGEFV
tara:strand:- start:5044 stop:5712 length:669 start_codon:yes stop_codon:yes gene_type:complete